MTPLEELTQANLPLTRDIEVENGSWFVHRDDGTVFHLNELSDGAYWLYMEWREQAWYRPVE